LVKINPIVSVKPKKVENTLANSIKFVRSEMTKSVEPVKLVKKKVENVISKKEISLNEALKIGAVSFNDHQKKDQEQVTKSSIKTYPQIQKPAINLVQDNKVQLTNEKKEEQEINLDDDEGEVIF
jgi:hypothetical protein